MGLVTVTVLPPSPPPPAVTEVTRLDKKTVSMRPGPSAWPRPDCAKPYDSCKNGTNPCRTHRFYKDTPVVPFGFGLSYTTFRYGVADAPTGAVSLALDVNVILPPPCIFH